MLLKRERQACIVVSWQAWSKWLQHTLYQYSYFMFFTIFIYHYYYLKHLDVNIDIIYDVWVHVEIAHYIICLAGIWFHCSRSSQERERSVHFSALRMYLCIYLLFIIFSCIFPLFSLSLLYPFPVAFYAFCYTAAIIGLAILFYSFAFATNGVHLRKRKEFAINNN